MGLAELPSVVIKTVTQGRRCLRAAKRSSEGDREMAKRKAPMNKGRATSGGGLTSNKLVTPTPRAGKDNQAMLIGRKPEGPSESRNCNRSYRGYQCSYHRYQCTVLIEQLSGVQNRVGEYVIISAVLFTTTGFLA
jgi:hypothetical protein